MAVPPGRTSSPGGGLALRQRRGNLLRLRGVRQLPVHGGERCAAANGGFEVAGVVEAQPVTFGERIDATFVVAIVGFGPELFDFSQGLLQPRAVNPVTPSGPKQGMRTSYQYTAGTATLRPVRPTARAPVPPTRNGCGGSLPARPYDPFPAVYPGEDARSDHRSRPRDARRDGALPALLPAPSRRGVRG